MARNSSGVLVCVFPKECRLDSPKGLTVVSECVFVSILVFGDKSDVVVGAFAGLGDSGNSDSGASSYQRIVSCCLSGWKIK